MGKYTKQKDGRYRASISSGYDSEGKLIRHFVSGRTIKELEDNIAQMKENLANGLLIKNETPFGKYADLWLETFKKNKGIATQNMYENSIKNHMGLLRDVKIKDITRTMIQAQINQDAAHPRTCEITLLTLKQIFKSAVADGHLVKSPCEGIELPRHVKKEKRALTQEEKEALRTALLPPRERAMLLLLYGTGCRPAEAYALNKSDIDFKTGRINVNKSVQFDGQYPVSVSAPKTDSSIRSIVCSESILRGLKFACDKIPTENILGSEKGGDVRHKSEYRTMFRHILEKAGLKDSGITMYTLRHNFATECYYAGISLKECQRQMGHSDYKMVLEVYSHLDSEKENTREKLAFMVM